MSVSAASACDCLPLFSEGAPAWEGCPVSCGTDVDGLESWGLDGDWLPDGLDETSGVEGFDWEGFDGEGDDGEGGDDEVGGALVGGIGGGVGWLVLQLCSSAPAIQSAATRQMFLSFILDILEILTRYS